MSSLSIGEKKMFCCYYGENLLSMLAVLPWTYTVVLQFNAFVCLYALNLIHHNYPKLYGNMFELPTYAVAYDFQLVVICTHGAAMHSVSLGETQHRNIQHYL